LRKLRAERQTNLGTVLVAGRDRTATSSPAGERRGRLGYRAAMTAPEKRSRERVQCGWRRWRFRARSAVPAWRPLENAAAECEHAGNRQSGAFFRSSESPGLPPACRRVDRLRPRESAAPVCSPAARRQTEGTSTRFPSTSARSTFRSGRGPANDAERQRRHRRPRAPEQHQQRRLVPMRAAARTRRRP